MVSLSCCEVPRTAIGGGLPLAPLCYNSYQMRIRKLRRIALLLGILLPLVLLLLEPVTDPGCVRGLLGFLRSEDAYVTFTGEFGEVEISKTGVYPIFDSAHTDIIDSIEFNDLDVMDADTPIKVDGIYVVPLVNYNNTAIIDYLIVAFLSGLLLLFYFYTSEKVKSAISLRHFLYLFYVIAIEAGIFLLIYSVEFSRCFEF